ncbi:hypothetical protein MTP99_009208 [Tenebrio molitor]|nr:hypothetical protein MTP99_009208 [Tenebrio molitor]
MTNMTDEKPLNSDIDVEKQEAEKNSESDEFSEPLEKAKEKPPPGINASLVLLYTIFFFMFTIGWINLNNCSVSRLIPVYLIVAGFVGALAKFISKTTNRYLFNVTIFLVVFYFVWHGLGQSHYLSVVLKNIYPSRTAHGEASAWPLGWLHQASLDSIAKLSRELLSWRQTSLIRMATQKSPEQLNHKIDVVVIQICKKPLTKFNSLFIIRRICRHVSYDKSTC